MSFDFDEDILQDFLIEAGEILELLYEQLVELENNIEDLNLLNAIFRGFHTIKGGAGFLQLTPLVELCHIAENAFDELRKGKISISPELMDVVLQATDAVKAMFDVVTKRQFPEPADPEIIKKLHALVSPADVSHVDVSLSEQKPVQEDGTQKNNIEDSIEEKSTFIDADDIQSSATSHDKPKEKNSKSKKKTETKKNEPNQLSSEDEITEKEFDQLLETIKSQKKSDSKSDFNKDLTVKNEADAIGSFLNNPNAEITDDEFESLLDNLGANKKIPVPDLNTDKVKVDSVKQEVVKVLPVAQVSKEQASLKEPFIPKEVSVKKEPLTDKDSASKDTAAAETTVRVDTKRLDDIMNMVGELVLVRNRLVRLGLKSVDEAMSKAVANLDVVTADLQMSVMKTRMQPIKKVFGRFPRVVRDLARNLNKEVSLELKGEETDLDKNLVEALSDPLVHLVRNSVDHGIESPERRVAAGKPRVGTVVLSAEQEGDHIMLTITDDGAGMDPRILKRKAVEKGLMDQESADRLSENETFNLIFHPGFSTKDQISDVSGRGVGMDVVKTKITQLNGSIQVESVLGKGSVIAIKVPLTLAIMPTLMVMLANQTFALPLVSVNEIFHLDISMTNEVDGQEVVIVREKALPLFRLKDWLIKPSNARQHSSCHVVIVSVGTRKVGFLVDKLIGQEEVVIKPLGKMLHGTPGMAGATITGDGSIALILDVPSLLKNYASEPNKKPVQIELLQAS